MNAEAVWQALRGFLVASCVLLGTLDLVTHLMAWSYYPQMAWRWPVPVFGWAVRGVLLWAAAVDVARGGRRGVVLAIVLLLSMPLLYLLPEADHAENQYLRRLAASCAALVAAIVLWKGPETR